MAVLTPNLDVIAELQALFSEQHNLLAAQGVREVSLVGSRARSTAGPASDVDLLLDLAPDATFGLLDLVTLKDELRDALGVEVDIVFRSRLRPYVAQRMTRDVVRLV